MQAHGSHAATSSTGGESSSNPAVPPISFSGHDSPVLAPFGRHVVPPTSGQHSHASPDSSYGRAQHSQSHQQHPPSSTDTSPSNLEMTSGSTQTVAAATAPPSGVAQPKSRGTSLPSPSLMSDRSGPHDARTVMSLDATDGTTPVIPPLTLSHHPSPSLAALLPPMNLPHAGSKTRLLEGPTNERRVNESSPEESPALSRWSSYHGSTRLAPLPLPATSSAPMHAAGASTRASISPQKGRLSDSHSPVLRALQRPVSPSASGSRSATPQSAATSERRTTSSISMTLSSTVTHSNQGGGAGSSSGIAGPGALGGSAITTSTTQDSTRHGHHGHRHHHRRDDSDTNAHKSRHGHSQSHGSGGDHGRTDFLSPSSFVPSFVEEPEWTVSGRESADEYLAGTHPGPAGGRSGASNRHSHRRVESAPVERITTAGAPLLTSGTVAGVYSPTDASIDARSEGRTQEHGHGRNVPHVSLIDVIETTHDRYSPATGASSTAAAGPGDDICLSIAGPRHRSQPHPIRTTVVMRAVSALSSNVDVGRPKSSTHSSPRTADASPRVKLSTTSTSVVSDGEEARAENEARQVEAFSPPSTAMVKEVIFTAEHVVEADPDLIAICRKVAAAVSRRRTQPNDTDQNSSPGSTSRNTEAVTVPAHAVATAARVPGGGTWPVGFGASTVAARSPIKRSSSNDSLQSCDGEGVCEDGDDRELNDTDASMPKPDGKQPFDEQSVFAALEARYCDSAQDHDAWTTTAPATSPTTTTGTSVAGNEAVFLTKHEIRTFQRLCMPDTDALMRVSTAALDDVLEGGGSPRSGQRSLRHSTTHGDVNVPAAIHSDGRKSVEGGASPFGPSLSRVSRLSRSLGRAGGLSITDDHMTPSSSSPSFPKLHRLSGTMTADTPTLWRSVRSDGGGAAFGAGSGGTSLTVHAQASPTHHQQRDEAVGLQRKSTTTEDSACGDGAPPSAVAAGAPALSPSTSVGVCGLLRSVRSDDTSMGATGGAGGAGGGGCVDVGSPSPPSPALRRLRDAQRYSHSASRSASPSGTFVSAATVPASVAAAASALSPNTALSSPMGDTGGTGTATFTIDVTSVLDLLSGEEMLPTHP